MIFSYFEIYFSVFKKSNSSLSDFECLEKCLEFLREFRRRLESLLKPPLYPHKETETTSHLRPLKRSCTPQDILSELWSPPSRSFYLLFNLLWILLLNLLKIQYSSCVPMKESETVFTASWIKSDSKFFRRYLKSSTKW